MPGVVGSQLDFMAQFGFPRGKSHDSSIEDEDVKSFGLGVELFGRILN
jgi:hypothetical protein